MNITKCGTVDNDLVHDEKNNFILSLWAFRTFCQIELLVRALPSRGGASCTLLIDHRRHQFPFSLHKVFPYIRFSIIVSLLSDASHSLLECNRTRLPLWGY